jgi:tRNA-dihydrouridine synthase A
MPPLSVAPMMQRTDRHFRFLMRLITRHTLLYTEMITTGALLHGDRKRFLRYDQAEHPVAIQLGGDDPTALAQCARLAEDIGYDEVNLNVGCPSDRVQNGCFGAALMARPQRVADAVAAMQAVVKIPVTVKHRIGIDELDRYEDMLNFVDVVASAGCQRFTVHARKAWLQGLSPKENRTVPPLRYDDVHRLKAERPSLQIEINGGFVDLVASQAQLEAVDGVMIGRMAYDEPWAFAQADALFFNDESERPTRVEVIEQMIAYIETATAAGDRPYSVLRHMLQLFAGRRGARLWRRQISENGPKATDGGQVLKDALASISHTL